MSLTYLGSLTVGDVVPSIEASLSITLPQLQAQLDGLIAASAQLTANPPTIAASLTLANDLVAGITAAIALGVEVPTLSVQLAAIASFMATLNAQIAILATFQAALGSAGIHLYAYSGRADGLGPALPTTFPGGAPGDAVDSLVMVTAVPASWAALGVVLKTS